MAAEGDATGGAGKEGAGVISSSARLVLAVFPEELCSESHDPCLEGDI